MPYINNDSEAARAYVKDQLESLLRELGYDTNPKNFFSCPDPAHSDSTPSAHYDRKSNHVHCFGCGNSFDTFDMIGLHYGLTDKKEIFRRAYEHFGLSGRDAPPRSALSFKATATPPPAKPEPPAGLQPDNREYFAECAARLSETDYFAQRGIPQDVAARFGCGYDPACAAFTPPLPAVIIPTGGGSYVARNTDSSAAGNMRHRKSGEVQLLNAAALAGEQPVFIVEGEFDVMAICAAGGEAVGLGGTSNVRRLLDAIKATPPTQPLIIAPDNDNAGQKCAEEIAAKLTEQGIRHTRAGSLLYGACKDANEALLSDRQAFAARIQAETHAARQAVAEMEQEAAAAEREKAEQARRAYIAQTQSAAYLQAFMNGISAAAETEGISTGFNVLNTILEGGLYEGLYVIGAISSLGKTTMAMQIVDQIAAAGHDVLIFSLEMSRFELISKSISRHTAQIVQSPENKRYEMRHAKTARGITQGSRYKTYTESEHDLIQNAIMEYSQYAERVFIHEGVGNIGAAEIRQRVEEHVRFTGNRPVVLVDYLQILSPADVRATDKQNTDKAVLELKRLSRDLKTPVLAISSFNRESYGASAAMSAFKESGAIEYTSDVLIGLQFAGAGRKDFDVDAARRAEPRQIEAVILKNRYGRTGVKVLYNYFPKVNLFIEIGEGV